MPEENNNSQTSGSKKQISQYIATAAEKADALYNKLPLDKINEKLKGKVDVKTRKFKIILGAVVCILLLFCLKMCFSSSKIIIPNFPYTYCEEQIAFVEALNKADMLAAYMAFGEAKKVGGKWNIVGLDARDVFNVDFVQKTFGDKGVQKFKKQLDYYATEEGKKELRYVYLLFIDRGREVEFILDNVVDEANEELARRRDHNKIKGVKLVKRSTVDFDGVGDVYESCWEGEFIAEDPQGREYDRVIFSCNVCWNRNKGRQEFPGRGLCGDASLSLNLIWFGTDVHSDNWMSSGY